MNSTNNLKNHKHEYAHFRKRLLIVFLICVAVILILVARLYQLQVTEHHHFTELSQKNRLNETPIKPRRGRIYDRHHRLLATNRLSYDLQLQPNETRDVPTTMVKLQKLIHMSSQQLARIQKQFKKQKVFQRITLKKNLSDAEVARVYAHHYALTGIHVVSHFVRHYPMQTALTSVLGYLAPTHDQKHRDHFVWQGKNGIEQFYEYVLRGEMGHDAIEVNVAGWPQKSVGHVPAVAGHDIVLTIDAKFQQRIYQLLKHEQAAAVAIDPQNGDILAMVSHPSFDNNLFASGIDHHTYQALIHDTHLPLFNRALNGQFPPASALKPFIALAALEQGVIGPTEKFNDTGSFRLPHTHHIYRDWVRHGHGRGPIDISQAIVVSSDTFFYNLAVKMGMHQLVPTLKQFGFGQPIQLDMHVQHHGILSTPAWKMAHQGQPWYTGDTIISFIGQGNMLTTPFQMAQATSLLAMRGHGFEPHFIHSIETSDHHAYVYKPVPHPKIQIKKHIWDLVIKAMQGVIFSPMPDRTGWRFGQPTYTTAGKTGTAQVVHDERKRHQSNIARRFRDHSWFIAFAPVKTPKIAIAVLCEHSSQAARIARHIMDAYLIDHKPQNRFNHTAHA